MKINHIKRLGKGSFSTAYLLDNNKAIVYTNDNYKSLIWEQGGSYDFLPKYYKKLYTEDIDYKLKQSYDVAYIMEYLPATNGLKQHLDHENRTIYKDLKALQTTYNSLRRSNFNKMSKRKYDEFAYCNGALSEVVNRWEFKNKEFGESFNLFAHDAMNYGDTGMDLSPRNVRAKDGKLILLDIWFDMREITLKSLKRMY